MGVKACYMKSIAHAFMFKPHGMMLISHALTPISHAFRPKRCAMKPILHCFCQNAHRFMLK